MLRVLQVMLLLKLLLISASDPQEEVNALKEKTKILSDQLEKWNNLFLNSLEPRMASAATSLANIDSNINNLQERAHIWDTFQLHVAAWNDQLATLDRKADIISKGQEKILALEPKIDSVANLEYKMNDALKKIDKIQETVASLKEESQDRRVHKDHDFLFGEFATRGILSSVKMIERKLDRLLLSQQNFIIRDKSGEKPKLTIKCNTPRFVEELLNDISSKVDVIFDNINGKDENENDYVAEDYVDDGSGTAQISSKYGYKPNKRIARQRSNITDELLERTFKIEAISRSILEKQSSNFEKVQLLLEKCDTNCGYAKKLDKISSYLTAQERFFEAFLSNFISNKTCATPNTSTENNWVISEPLKFGCEDLGKNDKSGVYVFGNVTNTRTFQKKYCLSRDGEFWTVIQKRDDFLLAQNFNLSWSDYKRGFGNFYKDFWFGNDFISTLTKGKDVVLRIELEDFSGNQVWAEYSEFLVLPEENNYQLIVGGYTGNASDSLSSHNGSFFSTFDKKNDKAPECCPCAVSYGAGWWFNSCFESNLNGLYRKKGEYSGHFEGIIWETWLGNYSLKKTLMMVKRLSKQREQTTTLWPYYEDP